jgi:hypothetical protein
MTDLEEELDVCPFLTECDPGYEDMMDFCGLNYDNCKRYEEKMRKKQILKESH